MKNHPINTFKTYLLTFKTLVMNRKTFIRTASASALISIPVVSLLSCSSSDDGAPPQNQEPNPSPGPGNNQANCVQNGTNSTISANHGHSLSVSKEDVNAAVDKTYTLSQASTDNHEHQITITQSQFNTLKGNSQITVTSTSDVGHTHSVTVSCA